MNNIKTILIGSMLVLSTTPVSAGQVTIPNSFSAGTPAVASEVNANFNAVANEVNDNDNRITAIESQVSSGAASVAAHGFRDEQQGYNAGASCVWRTHETTAYGYYNLVPAGSSSGLTCDAVAGIQLPDKVDVTAINCTVYDNSAQNTITGFLHRVNLTTGARETMYQTAASVDSTNIQILSDTTINTTGAETIDNSTYAYWLVGRFSASSTTFESLGSNGRVYGCTVSYN